MHSSLQPFFVSHFLQGDFTMHRTPLDFSLCSRIKYRPNINKTCFKSCRFSPCLIIGEKIVKLLKMQKIKQINEVLNYFTMDRTIFTKHRTAIAVQQRLKITTFSGFNAKIQRFGNINLFNCNSYFFYRKSSNLHIGIQTSASV